MGGWDSDKIYNINEISKKYYEQGSIRCQALLNFSVSGSGSVTEIVKI